MTAAHDPLTSTFIATDEGRGLEDRDVCDRKVVVMSHAEASHEGTDNLITHREENDVAPNT